MKSQRVLVGLVLLGIALAAPHGVPVSGERAALSGSWIASAQREITAREYQASENKEGLQAPNRAHDLRTYFEPTGIRIHDRTRPGSPELVSLRLSGIGRSYFGGIEALDPVAPGSLSSNGRRVEVERPGIVEWYVNSEAGLEQGFTLQIPPSGTGSLVIELVVDHARASLVGDGVVLASASGRRLGYSKLEVFDANEMRVAAHFEVPDEGRVRLVVADETATYPLVIDPLLTAAPDAQIEADQAGSLLGYSVAGAGDVNGDGFGDVVVGAILYDAGETDEGAAFLFLGGAEGIASGGPIAADSVFESNQEGANLGSRVSSAGDVNGDGFGDLLVGAYAYDAGETDEGAFFLYHGSPSGIPSGGPLDAVAQIESNQEGGALFSGASAGDVDGDGFGDLVLGAANYEATPGPGMDDSGAAFVFLGSPTGITSGDPSTAATRLSSQQGNEFFAAVVSSAGDVNGDGYDDVIVGAPFSDAGNLNAGAAYVYLGGASGIGDGGPLTASTVLEGAQVGAELGFSVDAAGDVNGDGYSDVIIGAVAYESGEGLGEGSAFLFHGSAAGIASGTVATAATRIDANQAGANLGNTVAGAGDVNGDGYADVIVGAYAYDGTIVDAGVALVFLGGSAGIPSGDPSMAFAKLESVSGGNVGFSVDSAGDLNGDGFGDVVTGAYTFDSGQGFLEGAAFVFLGGAEGVRNANPATAAGNLESGESNAILGQSVAGAGDVNGDGYDDVIVGAINFDTGVSDAGAAFVFLGSATGISDGSSVTADSVLASDQALSSMGQSVSGAGDVNGDGYADVIVGASSYSNDHTHEGVAFVFLGSASGIVDSNPTSAAARLEADQEEAHMGICVSSAGDVNGDGFADVIVGAADYDSGQINEGAAFIFLGSESGIMHGGPGDAATTFESNLAGSRAGYSVSGAGDVNGDGYSDVIIGALNFDSRPAPGAEGAAFLLTGSASGIADGNPSTAAAQIESDQGNSGLGLSVSGAGDVNGDGYADVIVGANGYDSGQPEEGVAFVFLGSATGIPDGDPTTAAAKFESDQASAQMGFSVSKAGDVNGDGFGDVLVGAFGYDAGQSSEGAAFFYLGSADGISGGNPATAASRVESDQVGARLGRSVAGAGDVNGDGYSDVIVGAPEFDTPPLFNDGAAFVYLGNGDGIGRPVLARQFRSDATNTPIQPGGWTGDSNAGSFEARMRATHPMGRGRVKLEVETCAESLPFGDVACAHDTTAAWADVTTTSGGVELSETIGDLAADTHYRWRARVLHAPYSVIQGGVVSPPNPAHGPWRRVSGQAIETNVLPEPGMGFSVAIGASLLSALWRRRGSNWRY